MGLFWAKYARRIFAIVSTTSIPDLAPVSPTEATVDPPSRGSRLDADHPANGVLIPCRFTLPGSIRPTRPSRAMASTAPEPEQPACYNVCSLFTAGRLYLNDELGICFSSGPGRSGNQR